MKWLDWLGAPLSKKVLRIIVTLTVGLYAAFFLVGYNHPFAENPDFTEPRLTAALILFMLLVVVMALAVTAWAVVSSIRKQRRRSKAAAQHAPVIIVAVAAFTILLMLAAFFLGSDAHLSVNGKDYTDTLGLRMADMFVFTSLALMVVAAAAAAVSTVRTHFRRKR